MPENPRDRQDIRTSGGTVALGTCSRRPCSRVPRLERRPRQPPPPASIVVTKYSNDNPAQGTLFTRPLCPYPLHAYYTNGDPTRADSFVCGVDSRPRPTPIPAPEYLR
jgi:hypothetical protein